VSPARSPLAALLATVALLAVRPASAEPTTPPTPPVTPPQVLEHVDASYPRSRLGESMETAVVVFVTVEKDGKVGEATIAESGGADFDEAALAAVKRWRFSPALKAGNPVRARIRIPFHFAPDGHAHVHIDEPAPKPAAPADTPAPKPTGPADKPRERPRPPEAVQELPAGTGLPHAVSEPGKPIEIHVQGRTNPPRQGASDFRLDTAALGAAPHQSAADLLASAPGVNVTHPEGDVVAQRVYLRGFDADHGQDISFRVGPIPMNQVSHLHGQGYADLNLIIPETVRSIRVLEGVYDPAQGDFSVAGTVEYDLGVQERGVRFKGTLGSFGTKRLLALWAPEGQAEETFVAGAFRSTNGFGDGTRGSISGGMLGQYRLELPGDVTGLLHVGAYGGRSGIAGVLRRDDIDAGRVDFHGTYKDPSARSQSAAATRTQTSLTFERATDDGSFAGASIWFSYSTYRSRLNFTGYTQRSRVNPDFVGKGDLVEQSNQDLGFGARLGYRTRKVQPTSWLSGQLSLGAEARTHGIDQTQALLAAPQNETWDQRADTSVHATSVGLHGDLTLLATKYVRAHVGMRADLAVYDVNDRLGNFIPAFQIKSHIEGFRRTAAGVAWGPRANVEVSPFPFLRLTAAYGEGYRSPQARTLDEGENAPFAKVRSYEVGVKLTDLTRLSVTAIAYETRLSYDLAFNAVEGALTRIGPTTRRGFVAYFQASPIEGFTSSLSATYVHATLDSPPPATPSNPSPAFVKGQQLPFVPPVVVRADVGYRRVLTRVLQKPLEGRIGYGMTFLSPRPLPYAERSPAVFLADAAIGLRRDFLEIGAEALNLLDARYADTEYSFVSNWQTTPIPSLLPARHISAGAPFTFLATATLYL
jgi:iron complex outermembrane receptor protein